MFDPLLRSSRPARGIEAAVDRHTGIKMTLSARAPLTLQQLFSPRFSIHFLAVMLCGLLLALLKQQMSIV
jgi:hypothetical protein